MIQCSALDFLRKTRSVTVPCFGFFQDSRIMVHGLRMRVINYNTYSLWIFMRNVPKWIRTQILFMLKSPFGSFFDVELFQFYQIRLSSSLYIFRLYKLTVFTVIHFYTFLYRFKRVQTVI